MENQKIAFSIQGAPIFIRDLFKYDPIDYRSGNYPIYVIDRSILMSCPDIIPSDSSWRAPRKDLCHTHLIVPLSVMVELEEIAVQDNLDRFTAKALLQKVRQLFDLTGYLAEFRHSRELQSAIYLKEADVFFTVLADLSFISGLNPSAEDSIGQLIISARQLTYSLEQHIPNSSSESRFNINLSSGLNQVTILTNDHLTTIRARAEGINTAPFRIQDRIYTGRRNILVPLKLYELFINSNNGISYEEWQEYLPHEPALMANEFVCLSPITGQNSSASVTFDYTENYRHLGRFDAYQDRIVHLNHYKNLGLLLKNEGQAMYTEAIAHPDITVTIVTGPAGSGKTFISTIGAVEACKSNNIFLQATIVPCSIEVQRAFGFLPGDLDEKISPNIAPIKNALANYVKISNGKITKGLIAASGNEKRMDDRGLQQLIQTESDKLYEKYFKNVPVEAARGLDFSNTFVIYDEFQDQNPEQADMLLKRIGKSCKIVISGDIRQIHQRGLSKQNNGISYAKQLCTNLPMVAQIELQPCEVVRSDFVQAIVKRQS